MGPELILIGYGGSTFQTHTGTPRCHPIASRCRQKGEPLTQCGYVHDHNRSSWDPNSTCCCGLIAARLSPRAPPPLIFHFSGFTFTFFSFEGSIVPLCLPFWDACFFHPFYIPLHQDLLHSRTVWLPPVTSFPHFRRSIS